MLSSCCGYKEKLNVFAEAEIDTQRKKLDNFNKTQADLISAQIVQKITNHFAHHLKEEANSSNKSLELIQKIFQLDS